MNITALFTNGKEFQSTLGDDGGDVFMHVSSLPDGVTVVRPGTRVEFGVAEGRRGLQTLSVRILESPPSVVRATRKPAEDLGRILEDVMRLLERTGENLRRGRYPDDADSRRLAKVLRAIADDLDV